MRCPRCDAAVAEEANFCTACGLSLRQPEPAVAGGAGDRSAVTGLPGAPVAEPRLVACPACDASNAASRRFCGRCGAWMRPGEVPDESLIEPPPRPQPAAAPAAGGRDSAVPAVLVVITVLTALAVVGVVLTLLSARGTGLFAGPPEPTGPPPPVAVVAVGARASSEVPPSGEVTYGPDNVIDGDESTAWKEGAAGDGAGEWVEVDLDGRAEVRRILIYNGYQKPGRFGEHNRVAQVRVDVGERVFTADLLDLHGPQAVDLPEPVPATRVRLEIADVHGGSRYEDTAISEIEVYAEPEGP